MYGIVFYFPKAERVGELDGRRVEIGPLPLLKNCSREVNERDRDVTTAIVPTGRMSFTLCDTIFSA